MGNCRTRVLETKGVSVGSLGLAIYALSSRHAIQPRGATRATPSGGSAIACPGNADR